MICLDTNFLIRGVAESTDEAAKLIQWIEEGETLITAMPAWFEFICGPVTEEQKATMRAFLSEIVPFSEAQAIESARLFNAIRRKRAHRHERRRMHHAVRRDEPTGARRSYAGIQRVRKAHVIAIASPYE